LKQILQQAETTQMADMFVFVSFAPQKVEKADIDLITQHHAVPLVHLGFYALADWLLDMFRLAACVCQSSKHLGKRTRCRKVSERTLAQLVLT